MDKFSIKSRKFMIIFAFLAFFILFLSITLSIAYFSGSTTRTGQITLGEIDFCIFSSTPQSNIIMPNMYVGQTTQIINSRNAQGTNNSNLCKILYRFSVYEMIDNSINSNISEFISYYIDNEDYIFDGENKFYYLGYLSPGESEILIDDVFLNSQIPNQYQNRELNFVFSVEAIQAENYAYQSLWQDAPETWLTEISTILSEI